jgi:hypothetical protein
METVEIMIEVVINDRKVNTSKAANLIQHHQDINGKHMK